MKHVLSHGNTFYIKVCPYCNCEFIYQHDDISLELNSKNMYTPTINCPECYNVLEADKILYNESSRNIKHFND